LHGEGRRETVMAGAPAESMPLLCAAIGDGRSGLQPVRVEHDDVVRRTGHIRERAAHVPVPFDAGCFGSGQARARRSGRRFAW
jgi:hypothetical protein